MRCSLPPTLCRTCTMVFFGDIVRRRWFGDLYRRPLVHVTCCSKSSTNNTRRETPVADAGTCRRTEGGCYLAAAVPDSAVLQGTAAPVLRYCHHFEDVLHFEVRKPLSLPSPRNSRGSVSGEGTPSFWQAVFHVTGYTPFIFEKKGCVMRG